jgi:phosphate starvation-inducible membrane PsiE
VETFHYLALFAIGAVTAWAAVVAFNGMLDKGHIMVDDFLLLFICLELGVMVGIYFKAHNPFLTQASVRLAGWQA